MSDGGTAAAPVRSNDVAVIGMCGRFPGAGNLTRFWDRLRAGDDMLTTFTDAELTAAGVPERVLRDPRYVNRAAILSDAFDFDHEFFGFTRREAKLLDPQQRVLLEVAWELLGTIGYAGGADAQAIGVFAGASMNTYLTNAVARSCDPLGYDGTELMIANDKDYLTTRISYKLGLNGPSVNVQTACSTSLVAVHLAVQSLLTGECDIALAGGVSVIANSYPGYVYSEGMILSPDGRCRPFDAEGAGTTFGDGVGLVALKRLAEAIEDGDQILAVVKGSAINNDGSDKIGYTAPSIGGQRAVISEAQAVAEVDADTITYVEAHGTATALGDPIEFAALSEAFADGGARPGQCALGSVKANVGHLAAAAGVAGFVKAVLALRHREIPGHPGFDRPNPQIDLVNSPFYINTLPTAWPAGDTPRRAGVSSFGIGGTNAHVVLEEAPPLPDRPATIGGPQTLAVSAPSAQALAELAGRLADVLEAPDAPDLGDVAFTLRRGRRGHAHRHTVTAADRATAAAGLRALADGERGGGRVVESEPTVSFLFGDVPTDEFRALSAQLSAVAETVERSPVTSVPSRDDAPAALVTASQVLATLWTESGVRPAAVGGAGAGEVLAACFAGVFGPSDAAALLAWRAGLIDHAPELRPRIPDVPVLSAVVGGELPQSRALDPLHWTRDVWEGERLDEAFTGRAADGAALVAIGNPSVLPTDSGLDGERDLPPVSRLLTAAGRLWTEGVPVDWSAWYGGRRHRVPLPVHALQRTFLRLAPPPASGGEKPGSTPRPAEWLYTPSWQRLGPGAGAHGANPLPAGPWLLFADSGGTGDSLADALREQGATVAVVRQGGSFHRADSASFVVDPGESGDYEKLFDALATDGLTPERVVHLWSLDIAPGHLATDGLDRACDLGLFSVLDVAGRLGRGPDPAGGDITVVARDVYDVTGAEVLAAGAAMTDAAPRFLSQESAGLRCRSIDIGTGTPGPDVLLAEILAPTGTPIAFRNGHRWTRRLVPVAAEPGPPVPTSRLRPGGVYLVAGGLGRMGLALAGHLARVAGATLVLVDQCPLPRPEAFDRWLAEHGAADPVSRTIEAVRGIEQLGATVVAESVDVTDARAMRELVAAARQRFGRIDGWFHCAADAPRDRTDSGTGRADRAAWRRALTVKVRGALVPAEIFAETPVDFGAVMRSPAAVPDGGDPWQAAADRLLSARSSGTDGLLAISWDDSLPPEQRAEVLDLVLRSDLPSRLHVSATDPERRARRRAHPEPVCPVLASPRRQLSGDELKAALAALWSEALRTEIDRYDLSLFEVGGDELLAVRLARRIEERLGVPLTAVELLANPTIDHLAAVLAPGRTAAPSQRRVGRRRETA
ncbi:SDR family oxidoreductase [Streptomyces sp. NPDC051913]|uniref:SDR family oxidoreductase n=1 Tax=Streptomyces sp. NPDC051913 TaxID=3365676 RepID=UPI0037D0D495